MRYDAYAWGFCRRGDKGARERPLKAAIDDPDFERPMIGATRVEARTAADAHGTLPGLPVAGGAEAGRRPAATPTGGLEAGFSPASRACDADGAPAESGEIGAGAAFPQKAEPQGEKGCRPRLCRQKRLAGNAFERLEGRRGTAARYCKGLSSFVAVVQIRCLSLWIHIL